MGCGCWCSGGTSTWLCSCCSLPCCAGTHPNMFAQGWSRHGLIILTDAVAFWSVSNGGAAHPRRVLCIHTAQSSSAGVGWRRLFVSAAAGSSARGLLQQGAGCIACCSCLLVAPATTTAAAAAAPAVGAAYCGVEGLLGVALCACKTVLPSRQQPCTG